MNTNCTKDIPYEEDADLWLTEWSLLDYHIQLRNDGWENYEQREEWVTQELKEEQELEEFARKNGWLESCQNE